LTHRAVELKSPFAPENLFVLCGSIPILRHQGWLSFVPLSFGLHPPRRLPFGVAPLAVPVLFAFPQFPVAYQSFFT
jgi:hypothetical protein